MNKKVFCSFIILFSFMAVIMTGCGGSSNKLNINNVQPSSESISMLDVRETEEFNAMIEEISADGTLAKAQAHKFYYFDAETFTESQLTGDLQEAYENGGVIVMYNAGLEDINAMRSFLGSVGESDALLNDYDYLDLYVLTKRTVNDTSHAFAYIAPHVEYDSENYGDYSSFVEFLVERWRQYFTWAAEIDDIAAENAYISASSSVRGAAANDITHSAASATYTIDKSYNYKVESLSIDGVEYEELGYDRAFIAQLTFRFFPVHSFTDAKDYYLVKCNLRVRPTNVFRDTVTLNIPDDGKVTFDRLGGYMKSIVFEVNINASETHADTSPKIDEAAYVDFMPKNMIVQNSQNTESISWEDNSGVYTGGTKGILEGGMGYSNSQTWNTRAYTITNENMTSQEHREKMLWTIDFDAPQYTDSFVINPSSAGLYNENFEWLWEISKPFWQARKGLSIYTKLNGITGVSLAAVSSESSKAYPVMHLTANARSYVGKTVQTPPHVTVHQRDYNFPKTPTERGGFRVLSEADWTVSSSEDWIDLAKSGGTATGDTGDWLFFIPKENTTGSMRTANIILTSKTDARDAEKITIKVTQGAN